MRAKLQRLKRKHLSLSAAIDGKKSYETFFRFKFQKEQFLFQEIFYDQ